VGIEQLRRLIQELNVGTTIFPGGMPSFFRCKIEVLAEQRVEDPAGIHQYEEAGLNLTGSLDPRSVDVVLCFVPRTSEFFFATPYYRLKAILACHGFSSQMVTPWTFSNLKWSHLNLATGIFAKAGRIPWVLGHDLGADMILGMDISNVVAKHTRAGGFRRFIGYVNVFDSYGRWLFVEGLAQPYSRDDMQQNMQQLLVNAIVKYRAMKKTDPTSIVIHMWKRVSRQECLAAERAIQSLLSQCKVHLVSIDSSHPFKLFDLRTKDGSFPRGAYVNFGGNRVLLSTTGESPIVARKQGTPRPLDIRIWNVESDKQDIVDQVLALTKLNWGSATPVMRDPVTLAYSKQLAHLTAAISEQEWSGITSPEVNQILSSKPWFI
jgi:argonaute-like protein implicated in RNA metabolism and viral defense